MYNRQDSIDSAYNFIQARVKKGYKYSGTLVYNVSKSDFRKITNDKYFFSKADGYLYPQSNAHKLLADETKEKLNLA